MVANELGVEPSQRLLNMRRRCRMNDDNFIHGDTAPEK
jgi:hypothetical protein